MKSWKLKRLSEVCDFVGGSQPPKSDFSLEEKEGYIRLIQIRDYKSDDNIVYIPKAKARRFCDENDIMIGRYGPPVFQILKGLRGAYNVALMKAVPDERVLSKDYAFLFLKYSEIQDYIINLSHRAAGQTGVNKDALEDYPILVPPLDEQERIVAIVGGVLSAIEQAKENVQRNLQNAKELFQSELNSIFATRGEGWIDNSIESCIKFIDYRGKTPVKTSSGIRLITAKNVKLGYLNIEPQEFIHSDNYDTWMTRGIPNYGDVVFTTEAPLANVAQIDLTEKLAFAQRIIVMQPNAEVLNQTFLKYMLLSAPIRKKILERGTGATVQGIKASLLKKIEISFPQSLEVQNQIVEKLDSLSEESKKLEGIYMRKLDSLEELKKSILQKAFSGELTATKELEYDLERS
ncbi:restriction endonuclease subunit S [Pontibacter ramchanderi]|uniref:Type I restriction enzyme S subunit n=1 Tax=Pontibacter ramchanderi TaxID=1179743 RepID=A0A2N3V105_9BACT|nr:restriction endonuclease subunit S [Pontibacter ramchanderi]PKV75295.1 type I restriction enzyme S subunit [Pontibacter ramchanderi]